MSNYPVSVTLMDCIEITTADNGFVLRYKDPVIVEQNADGDGGWKDPYRSRVYSTPETLAEDLTKLLPLMKQRSKETNEAQTYAAELNRVFAEQE
jgi:hypothetical protein